MEVSPFLIIESLVDLEVLITADVVIVTVVLTCSDKHIPLYYYEKKIINTHKIHMTGHFAQSKVLVS